MVPDLSFGWRCSPAAFILVTAVRREDDWCWDFLLWFCARSRSLRSGRGTVCSPHPPSLALALLSSSQWLASLKITLTSEGSLWKCLLKVFPGVFSTGLFCSPEFLSLLSRINVCNQSLLCTAPVGNHVLLPLLYYLKRFYKCIVTVGKGWLVSEPAT